MELWEFHHTRLEKGLAYTLKKGEVVTVYDDGVVETGKNQGPQMEGSYKWLQ